MCQNKVQRHELACDGVPFGLAAVAVVFFPQRGEERPRAQMEHSSLPSIRERTEVAARHGAVQEPHRSQSMRASGERDKLAPQEVPAVHGDESQKLRLACGVAERFQHVDRLAVGAHRRSLSAKRESYGVPPRVLPDLPP